MIGGILKSGDFTEALTAVEVHLSNVHAREAFRQTSYLSDVALGVITGLGAKGYEYALDRALMIVGEES